MTDYPDIHFRKHEIAGGYPLEKEDWYELLEDCQLPGQNIIIPERYVRDFAGVPRWLWPFFSPYGRAMRACILHDYMCTSKVLSTFIEIRFPDTLLIICFIKT